MTADKKYTDRIDPTRRRVVMGGIAALAAGCSPDQNDTSFKNFVPEERLPNFYRTMGQFKFTGQQGEEVNIDALQRANQNKRFTVSFGYDDCDQFCTVMNPVLAKISDKRSDVMHYIVNVEPHIDNMSQANRNKVMAKLVQQGMDPAKVTVLYPENERMPPIIANKLGLLVNLKRNDPASHYKLAVLYDKDGSYLDRNEASALERRWPAILNSLDQGKTR